MTRPLERPIALVGMMGAGKTVVAEALGERLGAAVADLDDMIEAEEGCSIADLFRREGEPYFRRREGELLRLALASGVRVIACGGGIVQDAAQRALLRDRCHVVWIEVSPRVAAARIGVNAATRPMLGDGPLEPRLAALLDERAPLYGEVATLRVVSDDRSPAEVAATIAAALGGARP